MLSLRSFACVALLLAGCAPAPTEIVVVVDSDLVAPTQIDDVDIRVTNDLAMATTATHPLAGAMAGTLPATLGVRPKTDDSAMVTITATARLGATDVVSAEVSTHFVPGRRLVLRIFLAASCVGVPCARSMTCRDHVCVGTAVDPSSLPPFDGHLPDGGSDAGPHDAGPTDGGPDTGLPPDGGLDAGDDAGLDAGSDAGSDAGGCSGDPSCDDGMACNGAETCVAGACSPGTPPPCDDGIVCTADSCDPTVGGCVHMPLDALCTLVAGGRCDVAHGGCQYPTCDASTCVPTAGGCETASCVGGTCDRATLCTGAQMCCGGACVVAGCDDGNPCTDDSCIPTGCVHVNNGVACSDGNACTTGDHCGGGACSGTPVPCDDGVSCTIDSCGGGTCSHVPGDAFCTAMAGGTCDALAGCQYPTCSMSTCMPDTSMCLGASCAGSTCNRVSTCSGAQVCCVGTCANPGCDDGDPCTADSCGGGGCVHSPLSGGVCSGGAGICNAGACCTGCLSRGMCLSGTSDGACGFGGHACSDCGSCSMGTCGGGDNCLSYFDVPHLGTTVFSIDTCAETNNFDFGTCNDGPPPPPFTKDAVLSAVAPGTYFLVADPGFTVGSLTDSGACTSGFLSCNGGGTWGTSGGSASGRFYWGVEKNGGGCGRVTVTVTGT